MKFATQSLARELSIIERARAQNDLGFFPSAAVLDILKLILAGSELSEVLTIIARLVNPRAMEPYALSGFPMATESISIAPPRPVFRDLRRPRA